jgi:hypothetical protein
VRIDHVIYATADLEGAAARVEAELGLTSIAGGRHDGLGTHNRIVPLGDGSFLELLAVVDPEEARRSALGTIFQAAVARGEGLCGWAAAVDDVAAIAARLGTPITSVGRQGMTARLTAVEEALAEPCLPFFIERSGGRSGAGGAPEAEGIAWLEVAGDAGRLERWLGGCTTLPLRVVAGLPGVRGLGVGSRELRAP